MTFKYTIHGQDRNTGRTMIRTVTPLEGETEAQTLERANQMAGQMKDLGLRIDGQERKVIPDQPDTVGP